MLKSLDLNARLQKEADGLMAQVHLPELLKEYEEWFVGGSYAYHLMCWRDLDIYVLDREHNLKRAFNVAYELAVRLKARKVRFTNNVDSEPKGLYWGIKMGDERRGAWKWDLWMLDREDYERHQKYVAALHKRMTPSARLAILEIKGAYWQKREYRDTITSDQIYRAVLDHGVTSTEQFAEFVARGERGVSSHA